MYYTTLMYFFKSVEYSKHDSSCPVILHSVALKFKDMFYIHSLKELHHDVTGVVFLKEAVNLNNTFYILQVCYTSRFFKEVTQTYLKTLMPYAL